MFSVSTIHFTCYVPLLCFQVYYILNQMELPDLPDLPSPTPPTGPPPSPPQPPEGPSGNRSTLPITIRPSPTPPSPMFTTTTPCFPPGSCSLLHPKRKTEGPVPRDFCEVLNVCYPPKTATSSHTGRRGKKMTDLFDSKKKAMNRGKKRVTRGQRYRKDLEGALKVVQLTDIHVDLNYAEVRGVEDSKELNGRINELFNE